MQASKVLRLGCAGVALTGALSAATAGATPASQLRAACQPKILDMGTLDGHTGSAIRAMNPGGWAVGYSGTDWFHRAVLWRDGSIIYLGLGGDGTPGDPLQVLSEAVDVNKSGVIAANRTRYGDGAFRASAWLWRDGVKTRLHGAGGRRVAEVVALNSRGWSVGSIALSGTEYESPRPVLWRRGNLIRLPLPAGASGY